MKFEINNQEKNQFEVADLEIVDNLKTRKLLAFGVFYVCVVFLMCSAAYGAYIGNFDALQTVSDYIKIPIATLLGYYFGAKHV
jgi:hypothetical protein